MEAGDWGEALPGQGMSTQASLPEEDSEHGLYWELGRAGLEKQTQMMARVALPAPHLTPRNYWDRHWSTAGRERAVALCAANPGSTLLPTRVWGFSEEAAGFSQIRAGSGSAVHGSSPAPPAPSSCPSSSGSVCPAPWAALPVPWCLRKRGRGAATG